MELEIYVPLQRILQDKLHAEQINYIDFLETVGMEESFPLISLGIEGDATIENVTYLERSQISSEGLSLRGRHDYILLRHIESNCYFLAAWEVYVERYPREASSLTIFPVYSVEGTVGNPVSVHIDYGPYLWERVDSDSFGTRAGGEIVYTPDFDGSLWPHYTQEPLPFAAQCLLPDGRYLRVFYDDNLADYVGPFSEGAFCVLVEGEEAPHWISMEPLTGDTPLRTHAAYSLKPGNSAAVQPYWVNNPLWPGEGYSFMFQFGANTVDHDSIADDDDAISIPWGENGMFYVFWNQETDSGMLITQS